MNFLISLALLILPYTNINIASSASPINIITIKVCNRSEQEVRYINALKRNGLWTTKNVGIIEPKTCRAMYKIKPPVNIYFAAFGKSQNLSGEGLKNPGPELCFSDEIGKSIENQNPNHLDCGDNLRIMFRKILFRKSGELELIFK
jgi:hypothetical protein